MVKKNSFIDVLTLDDLKRDNTYHIDNCIINTIDFIGSFEINDHIIIANCIIKDLQIHSCWFINGFSLKKCIIKNYIDYQMGGHNARPISLEGNIFMEFVNFFDCQFGAVIEVKNNIFVQGTNLLGNKKEGFANTFDKGWVVEGNLGRVDIDGVR